MEKKIGPTPNGGDYSVLVCFGKDGEPVEKEQAVVAHILEYKNDGTLVATNYLVRTKTDKDGAK